MNNINKHNFNKLFKDYLNGDSSFSMQLYSDVKALCYNVTYTYQFDEINTYDDMEQDLIVFLLTKCEYIRNKGTNNTNYYNLVFSILKRKFLDILRANKRLKKGIRTDIDVYMIIKDGYYELP